MNIEELINALDSIRETEKNLNDQINQLESERLAKEQSQLRLVGKEPRPVPKSEDQVRLEQERNNSVVNKNRLINIVGSYRQMKTMSTNSEFNGYTIQDFEKLRDESDSKRKELDERIQKLESERITKEQSQLRLVGKEPRPVPKSEEQIKLEQEKLAAEQSFQKYVNLIGIYNRIKGELDKLSEEKDMNKYLTTYDNLMYKAKQAGLPEQLIVRLMENKVDSISQVNTNDNENQELSASRYHNPNPGTINFEKNNQNENKEPEVANSQNMTREEEIYKLLEESSKRLRDALRNNDENAIAQERSYRQRLLNELNNIKEAENKKMRDAEIAKYEALLQASSERLQKAISENNEAAIAQERSYRQQILNKIAEIKGIKLEEPSKVVTPKVEEQPQATVNEEQVSEVTSEEQVEETEKEDFEQLNDEQIKERIKEIEEKRKEIDGKIIKIDLNAPWEESAKLMKEFIILGKEKEKLQGLLPNELEKNDEEQIKEPVVENKEEIEEIKPIDSKENEPEKEVIKEEKKEHKRKPKFKNFIKKILPKWAIRTAFAIKRAISNIINPIESIEIAKDIETDDEIEMIDEPEIIKDEVSVNPKVEEDLENTMDFSNIDLNNTYKTKEDLEKIKDILKDYANKIEEELGDMNKTSKKMA